MQKLAHQTLTFDDLTLDLTRGSLLRGSEEIKLRPKSFEALKYLVQNSGRLVTKDELIQAVWPDSFVTDDSLVKCVNDVRHALGDEGQRAIKTVPRRGYIFDKEVRESSAATPGAVYTEEVEGVHVVIEETEETNGHEISERAKEPASHNPEVATPRETSAVRRFTNTIKRRKRGLPSRVRRSLSRLPPSLISSCRASRLPSPSCPSPTRRATRTTTTSATA